ncbi:MAG: hypothetical protein ACR2NB_14455 [Solirubrobacteraceae bacterium]
MPTQSPLGAVIKGLLAGAAGTGVMTAAQTAYYKAMDVEPSDTPAQVGKRVIEGVLQRGPVPDDQMEALNNRMHWGYGTSWGVLYGLAAGMSQPRSVRGGLLFGLVVWGASLVELPAMKLSPPVWELEPVSLAPDVGFHLVYGAAVGVAFGILD